MVDYKKYLIGILTVLVSLSIIYVTFNDDLRIRIDNDKSTFYVYDSGWKVAGREYNRIFDGSKIVNRILDSIKIKEYHNANSNTMTITRTTKYSKGMIIEDVYLFDGDDKTKENFPIKHKVTIINGTDYIYRYTVDDLKETGVKRKLTGETELSFGMNMKVTLEKGYRWAWIGYPYGSDSLSAQYDITSDYQTFDVRLFDPVSNGINITILQDGLEANRTYELETTANITIITNSSSIICLDVDHVDFGVNYSCIVGEFNT
ncbi:MAG: hypothetical protein ABIJ08_01990, partial [Nanoarchaeota archaeon]